jgi:hypothetical protein
MEDMDTNIPSELNESDNRPAESEIIEDVDKSSQGWVDEDDSSAERFEDDESGLDGEYGLSNNFESEQYKENICPDESTLSVEVKSLNNHCTSRKRHYSEIEQAVISIGGQLDSGNSDNTSSNSTSSMNESNCNTRSPKIARLDAVENTLAEHSLALGHDVTMLKTSDNSISKASHVNIEARPSYRKSDDIESNHKISGTTRSLPTCGGRTEMKTVSQSILSHSNLSGILVATM